MAARNDILVLNSGTAINLRTFTNDYLQGSLSTVYSKGTKLPPASVFMLSLNVDNFEETTFSGTFGQLTGLNEEDLDDPIIVALEDELDVDSTKVKWLWGSLKKGGCYVRMEANQAFKIGGVSGFVHNLNNDTYGYSVAEAARSYDAVGDTADIEVMFGYGENSDLETDSPWIYIYSITGLDAVPSGSSSDLTWYGWLRYNALLDVYETFNCTNLYDPTRYVTYEGTLGDKPSMGIYPQYGSSYTYPYALSYQILGGLANNPNIEWLSGSVFGEALEDEEEEDPEGQGGYSESGGGFGSYPSDTSNIDFSEPDEMAIDVVGSGFVALYNPTLTEVKAFNAWLFQDVTDAMSSILKKLIADPIDYVLFLSLCHFTPPTNISDQITFAGLSTGVTANKITKQFCEIDCGTVHIDGDTQTFFDYNPYTKISLYLPYVGIVDMDPDDIVGSDAHIKYFVDLLTGSCICQMKCTRGLRNSAGDSYLNDILYTYEGNCYENVPLTGTDWRGLASSLIGAVGGVGTMLKGNVLSGASSVANAILQDKNSVKHSGSSQGAYGYMGIQKPYFILERPINAIPYNYRGFKGYTLNMRRRIGTLKGYTEIENDTMWVDSFNGISEEEADMLKDIISTGFYL